MKFMGWSWDDLMTCPDYYLPVIIDRIEAESPDSDED